MDYLPLVHNNALVIMMDEELMRENEGKSCE